MKGGPFEDIKKFPKICRNKKHFKKRWSSAKLEPRFSASQTSENLD